MHSPSDSASWPPPSLGRALVDTTPDTRRLVMACALMLATQLLASHLPDTSPAPRRTLQAELPVTLEQMCAGLPARLVLHGVRRSGALVDVELDVPLSPPWSSCTIAGGGDDLGDGRGRGDVHVTLRILPHATWRAAAPPHAARGEGAGEFIECDLKTEVPLGPIELYYGHEVRLDHPSGGAIEARHEGWSNAVADARAYDLGSVRVFHGAGLPTSGGTRGDAYVFFTLRMPALDEGHLRREDVRAAMRLVWRTEPGG